MKNNWVPFLALGFLGLIVFIFFFFRNLPIEMPKIPQASTVAGSLKIPTVTFVNPAQGPANAPVTIIEFGDYECTACAQLIPIIDLSMKSFSNQVRFVWKDLPNASIHPNATKAAVAAHCADKQGKFWEYHTALFDHQSMLNDAQFMQIASDISLDKDKFAKCLTNQDTLPIVQKDLSEGIALGIVASPTLYIGDKIFVGLQTIDDISNAIKATLPPTTASAKSGSASGGK